ncbi:MAG: hypothetical protein QXW35_04380 [Candidatus Aenigmatarchaeota archaeon]
MRPQLLQELTSLFTASAILLPNSQILIQINKGLAPFTLKYFDTEVTFDFPEYLITNIPKGVNLSDLQFYLKDSNNEEITISLGNPFLNNFEQGALFNYFKRQELFLHNRGGINVYFFKKRSSSNSEKCPACSGNQRIEDQFIPLINSSDSNCDVCFNTGYKDGYFPPILTMFNFTQNISLRDFSFEPVRYDVFTFFTNFFPSVEKDDLFYSAELNRLFRIITIQTNQYKGIPLLQMFQAQTVDQNSNLWKLIQRIH